MPTLTESDNAAGGNSTNNVMTIDQHHPLFLQSCDTPGSSLISIKLTGPENYALWSSSMRISLLGKSKLGFVTGKCPIEKFDATLHDLWEKCNAIVLSWIMNSVSTELLSGIVYATSAYKVWSDLQERFDKVNGSRIFYLHKQLATLSQGVSSVSSYFSKMRELWAEFDALMPCPSCSCTESKKYMEHFDYQRLLQFLMGLNESYSQSSNQIMMMTPIPSINKAYAMILSEESRRSLISSPSVENSEGMALFSSTHTGRNGSNYPGGGRGGPGSSPSHYSSGSYNNRSRRGVMFVKGVAIYKNTYEAIIMNNGSLLKNVSPNFDSLESGVASILTLNNNKRNSDKYLRQQLTPEACVFSAVRAVVDSAIDAETRMGASLIRLHFHDCFVDGCDGGILLDDINGTFTGEQNSPPNANSARGYEVIAQAKQSVINTCPNVSVSCADILAIAARDSIAKLGGQTYSVALGRSDARTANFSGAINQLPAPFDNLTVQIQKFSDKNFSLREMVALAGAHTVGFARCSTVCTSGNVNPAAQLQCNCSATLTDSDLQQLDTTPTMFDKVYYDNLNSNQGIKFSDQVLTGDATTAGFVTDYSNNVTVFLEDFAAAMIKMGNLPPSAGTQLEIRDVCSRVNPTSVASM